MRPKALVLLSGGLDSTLVAKLMLEQGVEIEAVNFITPFCRCNRTKGCRHEARRVCEEFGISLKVFNIFGEYLEVVKKPRFGYGKGMNPCIDCRILMFKKAKDYMAQVGASFIVTGEVLGQRPMSQHRKAMKIIEQESGLEDLVLRPLSAKLLKPTLPEREGWIDRERLLAISGRSRRPQINLAKDLQVSGYPCPAGGCLLTDPNFAKRMKDLLTYSPCPTLNEIELLKIGRHFRLSERLKIVVGRNEVENKKLLRLFKDGDLRLTGVNHKGPVVICRGKVDKNQLLKAASICARYCDDKGEGGIIICDNMHKEEIIRNLPPIKEAELESLRI
jgi:tRNA U34 2-thiouridine synthase MnmA/TrmU